MNTRIFLSQWIYLGVIKCIIERVDLSSKNRATLRRRRALTLTELQTSLAEILQQPMPRASHSVKTMTDQRPMLNVTWHLSSSLPGGIWETLHSAGTSFCRLIRQKLSFLAIRWKGMFGVNKIQHIIRNHGVRLWSTTMVAVSRCGTFAGVWGEMNARKAEWSLQDTWSLEKIYSPAGSWNIKPNLKNSNSGFRPYSSSRFISGPK